MSRKYCSSRSLPARTSWAGTSAWSTAASRAAKSVLTGTEQKWTGTAADPSSSSATSRQVQGSSDAFWVRSLARSAPLAARACSPSITRRAASSPWAYTASSNSSPSVISGRGVNRPSLAGA